ncbi:MAG: AAA family ATPase, partial [Oscillospiraceae bacterium]
FPVPIPFSPHNDRYEVIALQIHRMTATFGKLENQTLELKGGLNLLHAPNEAGKSTWCAFLATLLYGLSTRERGQLADKNRYAPWNGAAPSGRLDCLLDGRELTILRTTARANAPMGRFSAVYTGTAEEVPGLTAANCGETLLGIPREVFERSAFVRQAGLPVGQDAELERRIVSLITTGDEDTSYIETMETLKKQLNRRKHNKTGLLPTLTAAEETNRAALTELHGLSAELTAQQATLAELQHRRAAADGDRLLWDRLAGIEKKRTLQQAVAAADAAEGQAAQLRGSLAGLPANEEIARFRAAIVHLNSLRDSVAKAESQRTSAHAALDAAQGAVDASPFAGCSPQEAVRQVQTPPAVHPSPLLPLVTALVGTAAVGLLAYLFFFTGQTLPLLQPVMVRYGILGVLAGLLAGVTMRMVRSARKKAVRLALEKQYGTAVPEELTALAAAYGDLSAARDAAGAATGAADSAYSGLATSLTTNEVSLLAEVQRFAPAAFDLPAADAALRDCAVRRRELSVLETAAREAALRADILRQQLPEAAPLTEEELSLTPPAQDRTAVLETLQDLDARILVARSSADKLAGQLSSLGDPAAVEAELEEMQRQIAVLQGEYDAIELAMEALTAANTTLQNRFSPGLGRHAAEIFSQLTDGKYHKILLDRTLSASAEAVGDPQPHDARLLSQGACDQLYLALRLAICDLVLPPEVPLILDDALVSFDDARAAAALRYLEQVAESRQILLFTCQSREVALCAGKPTVTVQTL